MALTVASYIDRHMSSQSFRQQTKRGWRCQRYFTSPASVTAYGTSAAESFQLFRLNSEKW